MDSNEIPRKRLKALPISSSPLDITDSTGENGKKPAAANTTMSEDERCARESQDLIELLKHNLENEAHQAREYLSIDELMAKQLEAKQLEAELEQEDYDQSEAEHDAFEVYYQKKPCHHQHRQQQWQKILRQAALPPAQPASAPSLSRTPMPERKGKPYPWHKSVYGGASRNRCFEKFHWQPRDEQAKSDTRQAIEELAADFRPNIAATARKFGLNYNKLRTVWKQHRQTDLVPTYKQEGLLCSRLDRLTRFGGFWKPREEPCTLEHLIGRYAVTLLHASIVDATTLANQHSLRPGWIQNFLYRHPDYNVPGMTAPHPTEEHCIVDTDAIHSTYSLTNHEKRILVTGCRVQSCSHEEHTNFYWWQTLRKSFHQQVGLWHPHLTIEEEALTRKERRNGKLGAFSAWRKREVKSKNLSDDNPRKRKWAALEEIEPDNTYVDFNDTTRQCDVEALVLDAAFRSFSPPPTFHHEDDRESFGDPLFPHRSDRPDDRGTISRSSDDSEPNPTSELDRSSDRGPVYQSAPDPESDVESQDSTSSSLDERLWHDEVRLMNALGELVTHPETPAFRVARVHMVSEFRLEALWNLRKCRQQIFVRKLTEDQEDTLRMRLRRLIPFGGTLDVVDYDGSDHSHRGLIKTHANGILAEEDQVEGANLVVKGTFEWTFLKDNWKFDLYGLT